MPFRAKSTSSLSHQAAFMTMQRNTNSKLIIFRELKFRIVPHDLNKRIPEITLVKK